MHSCDMGNQRDYLASGGFSQYLYEDVTPSVTINGVTGKVIKSIDTKPGDHDRLPTYSNTSDIYFKLGEDGLAAQAKVYDGRKMKLDFDWNHEHTNKDGTKFPKGTVHVQVYKVDIHGNWTRISKDARLMTDAEIAKYGPIIKYFNPNVKFK